MSIAEHQQTTFETSDRTEKFISLIKEKLNAIPSEFLQPKDLHKLGLFGSLSSATHKVLSGEIPHVRISSYRILIAKEDILTFVRERFCAAKLPS